jgi:hypothetical protein
MWSKPVSGTVPCSIGNIYGKLWKYGNLSGIVLERIYGNSLEIVWKKFGKTLRKEQAIREFSLFMLKGLV